jgi:hypothetical protein
MVVSVFVPVYFAGCGFKIDIVGKHTLGMPVRTPSKNRSRSFLKGMTTVMPNIGVDINI